MKTKIILLLIIAALFNINLVSAQVQTTEKSVAPSVAKDTIQSPFSIGIFPLIKKSKRPSLHLVNNFSMNLFKGYANEINGVEIGGLINHVNGNVKFLQVAGLGNLVKDSVKGIQIAGLFNTTGKDIKGLQVGGIANYVSTVKGLQTGGILNIAKKNVTGAQIAGILNHSDSLKGLQVSGITNTVAKNICGAQIAGISNYADTVNGFQLAGIINNSKATNGFQLAGVLNQTKKLNGFQLAVINIADSATKGIPFGVFSYVKNGYHKLEVSIDEMLLATVGFRSGVEKLHSIFFTGIKLSEKPALWTYGYGLGSVYPVSSKLDVNISATSQQVQTTNNNKNIRLNLINKLIVGVDYKAFPKFNIGVAPTYNIIISDVTSKDYTGTYSNVTPYSFYNHTHGDFNVKMWIGARLSLKFL